MNNLFPHVTFYYEFRKTVYIIVVAFLLEFNKIKHKKHFQRYVTVVLCSGKILLLPKVSKTVPCQTQNYSRVTFFLSLLLL